jgi:acyl-coenzyme A synthetase/AMP-(fatty) acid ligase
MFGLEANIFAALGFGRCCYRDTIFYQADLETALTAARRMGRKRLVLVTSPSHLKFLEPTIMEAPEICCVLSATAPLAQAQAERLEARGDLKVMEIYGSTETGSLAFRRSAYESLWTPAAGFVLSPVEGAVLADAPHLNEPVRLGDDVEIQSDGRFQLLGRIGDMVSIHGKRGRLSAMNAVLSEMPELADGVCLHVKSDNADKLAIVAVPKDRSVSEDLFRQSVRAHMLKYFDPTFVPKRVLIDARINRTLTGKIGRAEMQSLISRSGLKKSKGH